MYPYALFYSFIFQIQINVLTMCYIFYLELTISLLLPFICSNTDGFYLHKRPQLFPISSKGPHTLLLHTVSLRTGLILLIKLIKFQKRQCKGTSFHSLKSTCTFDAQKAEDLEDMISILLQNLQQRSDMLKISIKNTCVI